MEEIRVLIIDDYPLFREGLCAMLSTDQTIEIVGEASDGAEAVAMVAEKKPNVVLMDIRMPNMDGIEATRRIKDKYPSTTVIMLTMDNNDAYIIDAVRAGASNYLLKNASRELLLHTIRTVSSGATLIKTELLYEAICSLVTSRNGLQKPGISTTQGLNALTLREQEVLRLVVDGYTSNEIGKQLGVAADAVMKDTQSIIANMSTFK